MTRLLPLPVLALLLPGCWGDFSLGKTKDKDTGEVTNPDADADTDADADSDADSDADTDADGDSDADTDADGDTDSDSDTDTTPPAPDRDGDGYTEDEDCDDRDASVNPGADELCNGVDDNCDGRTDGSDSVDADYAYQDADGDGFGDPATYDLYCDGVDNGWDCDDRDATEPQVVDGSSTTGRPDGTLARPWTDIQTGIDNADECVLVAAGIYAENLDYGGKDILVASMDGANSTIVDGSSAGPVVTFASGEGAGAEMRGFTLTNGGGAYEETSTSRSCGSSSTCTDYYRSWCGGGVYADGGSPTLVGLKITGNDLSVPPDSSSGNDYYYNYSFGGGVCARNTVLVLEGVDIHENNAEDGGALYIESGASVTFGHGAVFGNTADYGGGIEVDGGRLTITNAILSFNVAGTDGGGIYAVDANVGLTNVTVGECEAAGSGGGVYLSGTSVGALRNSIVYGADNGVGVLVGASASLTPSYNDVWGNTDGNYSGVTDPTGVRGNISSNPSFVSVTDDGNLTNDNWHLGGSSPCVDAGDSSSAYDDTDGSPNDMGAYGGPDGAW